MMTPTGVRYPWLQHLKQTREDGKEGRSPDDNLTVIRLTRNSRLGAWHPGYHSGGLFPVRRNGPRVAGDGCATQGARPGSAARSGRPTRPGTRTKECNACACAGSPPHFLSLPDQWKMKLSVCVLFLGCLVLAAAIPAPREEGLQALRDRLEDLVTDIEALTSYQ
ncbi:Hypp8712 [Branchiostoma lanceolatum]|uniref:Hypp8712 protein n=1 Tax=Branchiostoma lanceolatum TaxID=7740 RepID=A0A8K0EIS8_BRALA|nr:Hypp8712 [Branchiostoma lanceolatum]